MTPPRTLNDLYFDAIARFGERPVVMRAKIDGHWTDLSYRELEHRVRGLSLGLLELGIKPGEHVAILSENRPEWAIGDLAVLTARCADVPIYPTIPPHQIEYILKDSGDLQLPYLQFGLYDIVTVIDHQTDCLQLIFSPPIERFFGRASRETLSGGCRSSG